ncbi:MAG: hypothetical protein HQL88_10130 [Magnetococcales bacterium]|nr:hypothetical protein [Magnetococcales bacterium]
MIRVRRHQAQAVVAVLRHGGGIGLVHLLPGEKGALPRLMRALFQPETQPQAQERLLMEWVRQYGLQRARFVGLLDRAAYLLLPADAPPLPRSEWAMNLRWKIADRLPYPAEQAVVEFFDLPAPTDQEESGKIYVAVAQESTVQRTVDLFLKTGVSLVGLDIWDLAVGRLADALPEDAQGLALLYWTATGGVINVRRHRTLFLVRSLETQRDPLGQALEPSPLSPLDDARLALDTLAVELRRTFHFYENNFSQPPLEHLFVMPVGEHCDEGAWLQGRAAVDHGAVPELYPWQREPLLTPSPAGGIRHEADLLTALADRLGVGVHALPLDGMVQSSPSVQEADLLCCLPALGAALGWLSE